ncbi:MAG: beta-propeller fold lactonase family protein, partial [Methanosarcina sp.]|nr:beta-propeller fold lactonase family protein [Methanosarcina sp.]
SRSAFGVAVTPDGKKVYVTNSGTRDWPGNTVSVIDTATNNVTATVDLGTGGGYWNMTYPHGVAVTPDGKKVYVANFDSDSVSVIDTATNKVTVTVPVGTNPIAFGQFIASVPAPEPVPLEIQITQITTSGTASNPHIYGDRIVWEDIRDGKSDIYMYDLSTQQEAQISTSGTANYPAIYDNRIVWYDSRNGKCDVYMYDLSTQQETQISTSGTAYASYPGPDIYKDKIVWGEFGEYIDSTNLVMHNLSTQQETQITNSGSGGVSTRGFYGFALHGDKIVMCKPIGDDASAIYLYDLSTQETTWIDGGKPLSPDIYGDKIVWTAVSWEDDFYDEPSHYYYNTYIYDLLTQQRIQVSTSGTAYNPAIYNDRIVWEDDCNGQKIYMYDLPTQQETQITTSGSARSPEIYGDRIVWVDGNDIYVGILSYPSVTKNVQSVLPAVDGSIRDGLDSSKDGIADDIIDNSVVQLLDVERGDMPFEDRGIIEFDISKISGSVTNATLNLSVFSSNGPYPFKVDIFTYTGDGNLDLDDFNSGTHYSTFEYYGEETVQLDVTEFVENMVSSGAKYAAFNFQYVEPSAIPMNGPFVAFSSLEYPPAAKLTIVSEIFNEKPIAVLPVANFTANTTDGATPLTVQFTDLSTNATSWNWDFGDGTTSIEQSPVHTYLAVGNYTVNLTVNNLNGTDSKTATITVLQSIPPVSGKQFAYITNQGSDSVSVIDMATKTITATIPVGDGPSGVAVSPAGTKVYVTNSGNNTVSVINTADNTVTSTVNVGNDPYGVAVSPDGTMVYVTNLNDNSVSVINTATNQVIYTIPVGKWPEGVAFTPDGEKAYVANYYSYSTISVIDTATNTVISTVNDPEIYGPSGIAIAPNGKKAYVTSNFNDKLAVIDLLSNQVMTTVNVESGPHGVSVSPDGTRVYVVNGDGNIISVIDTATDEVIATVPVGNGPYGIAVSPDGKTVSVTNRQSN